MGGRVKETVSRSIKKCAPERGQGLVEYALVLILVGIVVVIILSLFGDTVRGQYCEIVYSVDPNIETDVCDMVDVQCTIISHDPFRMRAQVGADVSVDRVRFYADGDFINEEEEPMYCLVSGNTSCGSYTKSGTHKFSAIVYTTDGQTGKCSLEATVPE